MKKLIALLLLLSSFQAFAQSAVTLSVSKAPDNSRFEFVSSPGIYGVLTLYLFDKYQGIVYMIASGTCNPIPKDTNDSDIHPKNAVNYQLIAILSGTTPTVVLVNVNTGVMWVLDLKAEPSGRFVYFSEP